MTKYTNKQQEEILKKEGFMTLSEIERRFGKSQHTVRDWIRKGKLKAQKGKDKFYPHEYFIKLKDWLALPLFMREYRKRSAL